MPISSHASSRRFLKTLTDDESMTCCGNLFHSSIILFEKNVFPAVVLHLGLKSFCECPLNPYVSKAGWKKLALSTLSFSLSILYTSIRSPRNLRFSNEYIPSCFNLSSYVNFLSPLTSLVARLWICSRQSLSFIRCGDHAYWSKRQWVVVTSAGPYASLHLAPDRCQHPTTLFFTGRMPFLPLNQQHQSTEGILPENSCKKLHQHYISFACNCYCQTPASVVLCWVELSC